MIPGGLERLQRHRLPAQLDRVEGLLEPVEPLVAEADDQLAPGPPRGVRAGEGRAERGQELGELGIGVDPRLLQCLVVPRGRGDAGASEGLLGLVQDHDQRPVGALAIEPEPGEVEGRARVRPLIGRGQSGAKGAQQAQVGVAAEVAHLVRMLQPGHQAGVEHRRLAHAGGAIIEDHRPGAGVDDEVVDLADGPAPAEEHGRLVAGEPLEAAVGSLRQPVDARRGQAEQGVADRLGQAPAPVQLGAGGQPQLPGEAAVVGGVHGRMVGPAQVPGPEIGLRRRALGRPGPGLGPPRRRRAGSAPEASSE